MDEVLKRIQSSRNVVGVMVINNEVRDTDSLTYTWCHHYHAHTGHPPQVHPGQLHHGPVRGDDLGPGGSREVTIIGKCKSFLYFLIKRSIVRDLDPTNELTFLRVKSTKHEVLVAPDDSFVIIVLQHTRFRFQTNQHASLRCRARLSLFFWLSREEDPWNSHHRETLETINN